MESGLGVEGVLDHSLSKKYGLLHVVMIMFSFSHMSQRINNVLQ